MATYAAAREATRVANGADGRQLTLTAPFACADFTIAIPTLDGATRLFLDGIPLEQVAAADVVVPEGCWRRDGAEALVCLPLRDGVALTWD